jgi:hypothetical protein
MQDTQNTNGQPDQAPELPQTSSVATPDPDAETDTHSGTDTIEANKTDSKEHSPEKQDEAQPREPREVAWTASEFVAHDKSAGWYVSLGLAAVVVAVVIYLITKDKVSVAVVIVGALVLGVYGGHQPRELDYRLDAHSLSIGDKHHSYEEFRSFAVVPEGALSSIIFMPLKRFALTTTIYYAPDDEDKIVSLLADRLPIDEDHKHDAIDRLMRRIRF